MILAYAGRRAPALPEDPLLADRVRARVAALRPTAVVGSAADGADLMVLEAALASPDLTTVHVVLPTSREAFVQDSVAPDWHDRFEAVLAEVVGRGGVLQTLDLDAGRAAYGEANRVIIERVTALAQGGRPRLVLAIAREGEGRMVEDLVDRARLADIPVLHMDPSAAVTGHPG